MSVRAISRFVNAIRAADWWLYKIPPLLTSIYAGFACFALPEGAWAPAASALGSVLFVAVYGYILNDVCDVEADRLSDRPNRMAAVGTMGRAFGLIGPAAGAVGLAGATGDAVLLGLVAFNLLLPTLYSVPPVRLKGRGAWGALADALGVHAVPMAIVTRGVTLHADSGGWTLTVFVVSAISWALFTGLRGIIVHQVADARADELAQVSTLAGSIGLPRARQLVMRVLFPLEIAALISFLGVTAPRAPIAMAVTAAYIAIEVLRIRRGWRLPLFEPEGESREPYVPLINNELYEVWLPLGFAVQLAVTHPGLWLLVGAHAFMFWPNIRMRIEGVRRTLVVPGADLPGSDAADGNALHQTSAFRVVIAATTWTVNGVNVFSSNLVRGLLQAGVPAQVLLTEEGSDLVQTYETEMPRPSGVEFQPLPLGRTAGWGSHWGAMVRYLEEAAPCIYIPNSDWRHSCVSPVLSNNVVIVGIVHSDDPLHYDHVRRLGRYWNAIVAVSGAVAEKTKALCPEIADRIVTIPIGARIPDRHRRRRKVHRRQLRVIYHGILKQHQKRVLDLPRIIEAAAGLGVPVHLSIVGSGPDEQALREASASLVERGLITFVGVVSPDAIGGLLEEQDVYLLASEFEGMPNALIEAMGRGCVPVASRMPSGIPDLIQDGKNGFLAPIGDAQVFAQHLRTLWDEPDRRVQMSESAFTTVRHGGFRVEDMVASYQQVFAQAWSDAQTGRFVRPRGLLSHPPAEVAGVSLFPVPLPHSEPGIGSFQSPDEAADYREQVSAASRDTSDQRARTHARLRLAASRISLEGLRVIVSVPVWTRNGVTLLSEDLVRGLRRAGLDARLLLTEELTAMVRIDGPRLALPSDIPIEDLRVDGEENWGARWGAMVRLLEGSAPCVYLPNYDWRHSCVTPLLSEQVMVVGTMHETSSLYAEHATRLGAYWNGAIATSQAVASHVRRRFPDLEPRLAAIPHGFVVPAHHEPKPPAQGRMAVIVIGSGDNATEAVWIHSLVRALSASIEPFRTIVLDPRSGCRDALIAMGATVLEGQNREQWFDLCQTSHFVVAGPASTDATRAVVEAMGSGCIPVWMGWQPDGDRLVQDHYSGVEVLEASAETAVRRIRALASDHVVRRVMAERAHFAAYKGGYRGDQMINAYLELFRELMAERVLNGYRRPKGQVLPPPAAVDGNSLFPVELTVHGEFGSFPSESDQRRFSEESGLSPLTPEKANPELG